MQLGRSPGNCTMLAMLFTMKKLFRNRETEIQGKLEHALSFVHLKTMVGQNSVDNLLCGNDFFWLSFKPCKVDEGTVWVNARSICG